METKPVKEQRSGKLPVKNYVGYAMGDMAGVITFGTIGSFLQMFYTDILHISLGSITVLMMVARIWDAINDPMCGALIDAQKPTRHGRFRPYVWYFSIPLALAFIATFYKLPGLSEKGYLVYAYVTYILYGMMYTAVNIPYGSMASVMTTDQTERSTLSVIRSLGAGLGTALSQMVLPIFVYSTVVGSGAKYLDQHKLFRGVVILAALSVLIYFLFFKLTREYVAPVKNQKNENLLQTFGKLMKNRPFVTLCLASMLLIAGSMYTQTVFNYLFKNYFEKPGLFSLVTVATYLPMLLLMPFVGKLVRRYSKKSVCSLGSLVAALAFLALFFFRTRNPYVFLGVVILSGFGLCFFTLEVWAMVTDVIDYHEKLHHRRDEGTTYACFSFFRKLGQTLAGIGASMALAAIGYSTAQDAVVQTQAVNEGIYTMATIIPFVMYLCMFLLLQVGYPLTKKALEQLHADLEAEQNR
ncbi:MAG: MFS transporter [Oscillospiraceae bacterium]|nr:MFS transporter [Oscillospiraceae bacterium]